MVIKLFMKLKDDPAVEAVDLVASIMLWLDLASSAPGAAAAATVDEEGVDKKENPLLGLANRDDATGDLCREWGVFNPSKMD